VLELSQDCLVPGGAKTTSWAKATFFRSDQSDYELHLSVSDPGPDVIASLNQGEAEFALVIEEPEVILLFRFGEAVPWTVAHHDRFEGPAGRGRHHASEDLGLPMRPAHLDVLLFDSETQAIRGTRCVALWLDFTLRLDMAIREQARIAFDPTDRKRAMSRLEKRFTGPDLLARHAKIRSPGCA